MNSAGFREIDGTKTPLSKDSAIGVSVMTLSSDGGKLTLSTGETRLTLYRITSGLEGLEWNATGTTLLHREDILSLSQKTSLSDVETWGAAIDWPGAGHAKMVMFRLSDSSFTGFLISTPGASTLVRQMEFHLLSGPRRRSFQ
ncbi:hypothetical protein [Roseibium litorale]|uniref:Uncharacterized protein n=1 Tax=Roseibium litorale TaxID=2803841 RepID=A0ABR9CH78_9HYPH|nr:hypothetical protein [Roseibium litorale]MBD8890118.1 hypothetical protein [Roseibium litorale]